MTISKSTYDRALSRPPAEEQRGGSGRWLGLVALVPIVCCGLPLLLVGAAAAGTGALLGGVAGVVLLVAAVVLTVVTLRRRRAPAYRSGAAGAPEAEKERC